MLTAAHVVRGNLPLIAHINNEQYETSVAFIDPETVRDDTSAGRHPDVALLKVECPDLPWYPQFDLSEPTPGALITMFGFGDEDHVGGAPVIGHFSGTAFHGAGGNRPVYKITGGPLNPGHSGAAAFLDGDPARIIGLTIEASEEGFSFGGYIIPVSEFEARLRAHVTSVDIVSSVPRRPTDIEPLPDAKPTDTARKSKTLAQIEKLIEQAERERRRLRPTSALKLSREAVALAELGAPEPLKARAYRTNAIMLTQNIAHADQAKAMADLAIDLDGDMAADERVRALIAATVDGAEAAVAAITPGFTADLEILRAAFLVDSAPAEAGRILDALNVSDQEHPRARRVRLLAAIKERRVAEMLETAEKLSVVANDDYTIAFVVMVALYLAGLPVPFWPPSIEQWPEPIPPSETIGTDEQRSRYTAVVSIAETLLRECENTPEQLALLEMWKLAALCLDREKHEAAIAFANIILSRETPNYRALAWTDDVGLFSEAEQRSALTAVLHRYDQIEPPADAITLISTMLVHSGDAANAEALLTKHAGAFRTAAALSRFRSLLVHAKALQGDLAGAREVQKDILVDEDRRSSEVTIRTEDGPLDTAHLRLYEYYLEWQDPKVLLVACNLARRSGDWAFLALHGQELFAIFQTLATARLALYGSFNNQQYAAVLELYGDLLRRGIRSTSDILRLRALALDRLGSNDAFSAFDDLLHADPSDDNFYSAGYAHIQRGDQPGAILLARQLVQSGIATPRTALAFASWIRPMDADLAQRLWRLSMPEAASDDRLVLLAYTLSMDLGLESEAGPLHEPMHRLGKEGAGGIRLVDQQQVVEELKAHHARAKDVYERYRRGEISMHVATTVLNTDLYNSHVLQPMINRTREPGRGAPVFVRHGARTAADLRQPLPNVFLDATSYMIAVELGILPLLIEHRKVFVSRSLAPLLAALLEQRAIGNTPQRSAWHNVLRDIRAHRFDIDDMVGEEPEQIAVRRRLFVVDWASAENEERYRTAGVSWCTPRDLIDSFKELGKLSAADHDVAKSKLGLIQNTTGTLPPTDAKLLLNYNVTEFLYDAGLGPSLIDAGHVIPRNYVAHLESEEADERRSDEGAQWLRSALEQLRQYVATETMTLVHEPPLSAGEPETSLTIQVLRAAFSDQLPAESVVVVDDRSITKYLGRDDGVAIASLWDILRSLVDTAALPIKTFLDTTMEMRRRCMMYIPIETREILAVMQQATVTESHVRDSEEMRILERYVASALLDTEALYARSEETSGADSPQMAFILELAASVRGAIATLSASQDPADHQRAFWIRNHLTPEGLPGFGISGFSTVPAEAVIDVEIANHLAQFLQ